MKICTPYPGCGSSVGLSISWCTKNNYSSYREKMDSFRAYFDKCRLALCFFFPRVLFEVNKYVNERLVHLRQLQLTWIYLTLLLQAAPWCCL